MTENSIQIGNLDKAAAESIKTTWEQDAEEPICLRYSEGQKNSLRHQLTTEATLNRSEICGTSYKEALRNLIYPESPLISFPSSAKSGLLRLH